MSKNTVLCRRCFVCDDVCVLDMPNVSQNTQFSGTSVFKLLEQLAGHRIRHTETDIWCNECIAKIDNYDQAIFTAKQVQAELLLLLTTTVNSYNEIEIEKHKAASKTACESNDLYRTDDHEHLSEYTGNNSSNSKRDIVTNDYEDKLAPHQQVKKPPKLRAKLPRVNRFICDLCGQTYKSKGSLEVHLNRHNGVFPHECGICHKKFTQRGSLIRHMLLHTGEHPYQVNSVHCVSKHIFMRARFSV